MGSMFMIEGDRPTFTGVLAAVSQTAAAGICYFIAGGGAFVAGYIDHFDHIFAVRAAAHRVFYTLGEDGSFFVHAAAHGRCFAGDDNFGNVEHILQQRIVPCLPRYFAQYLILQILHFGIEFS